jgi:hypothetical protein
VTQQTGEPSIELTSFTCPSCNQLSEHAWFNTYAKRINKLAGAPLRVQGENLERLSQKPQFSPDVRKQKLNIGIRLTAARYSLTAGRQFIQTYLSPVWNSAFVTLVWKLPYGWVGKSFIRG